MSGKYYIRLVIKLQHLMCNQLIEDFGWHLTVEDLGMILYFLTHLVLLNRAFRVDSVVCHRLQK